MKTIGFEDIVDVMLNISDPNTGGAISQVPGVSSPKINAGTSVYNIEANGSGIAGWSTNVSWSASDYDTVAWGSGSIFLPDGTSLSVTSGNTGNMSYVTYIYYDKTTNSVATTTSAQSSVGEDKILLCVASPTSYGKDAEFQAFGTNAQSTFITADNIAANSITGNEIQANSITGNEIQANSITSGKIDVSQLSAISANLGSITAGTITGTTITAGSTSGTAVRMNPDNNRIEFYYGGSMVGYIAGASVDGNGGILINADCAGMIGRDVFDLYSGKLRIPVGTNLY